MQLSKIIYLVPDLFGPPGGIARYCRMVSRALAEADFHNTIIALNDEHHTETEVHQDGLLNQGSYWACNKSRRTFIWRALRLALRQRSRLIIVGHPNFAPLGWMMSRLYGAPFVVFIYGIDVWQPLSRLRRWSLQKADLLISISHFTERCAVQANGLERGKIRILPNCLDPVFAAEMEVEQKSKDLVNNPSLLTVARMSVEEQYKGHDYVIRALPTLLSKFPNLIYHIVGDGNWRLKLEEVVAQEGVQQAVKFHGVVDEKTLRQHFASATCFIMPSRAEGFGFVFLEAMAHGIPVIGGNVDASPEVISDGETGFIVDPTSIEEIIEAVTKLLNDADLRQRMGRAGLERAINKFGYEKFRATLLNYLDEVVQER